MSTTSQLTTSASPVAMKGASTLPTGIPAFDEATGGGFPTNRISVVYGEPDSGKTLLLYTAIAHYQQLDPHRTAVLFDLKRDCTLDWAIGLGIEPERLVTVRPDNAEQATEMLAELIAADDVGLIGVDSLACLISAEELEKSASEKVREGSGLSILRLLRAACLATAARSSGPAIVCVNHASGFRRRNDRHRMVGGAPPSYYASTVVRLDGGRHAWKDNVRIGMPDQKWMRGVVEKRLGGRCEVRFEYPLSLPTRVSLEPHAPNGAADTGGAS
jgi:RecA/RadA recombinase